MTPTPHGQVPEALIDLIDEYAETRHRCGGVYNAKTEAARNAVIEALSGVQALSAAPAGFVPVAAFDRLHAHAESLAARLLAASPTPPAEQAAPKAAPWEQNESAYQRGYMDGMAKGRRDVDAAPQQEPTEIPEEIERMAADRYKVVPSHESMFHRWAVVAGTGTQQLYLGREVECQNMARKFAGAFLDGAFVAMQRTAPKAAPLVGNSDFDHKTAADLLNNKTVSDEAVRKFVAMSRWAHNERSALSATLLAMHGVLTSREAEIALLKKALLEAETAPQPSPAPLSESIDQVERALAIIGVVGAIDGHDVVRRESALEIARRAALAAQRGNK